MTGTRVILRNAAFLLSGNIVTAAISFLMWLVVPRIIGPAAWGEFNLGFAIAALAFSVGGFGIATFLIKEISRDHARSSLYAGAGLATTIVLSLVIGFGVFLFALSAHYSPHTREVILLATAVGMCAFIVAPAVSALQALEKIHLNAVISGARQVVANIALIAVALLFKPDIVVLISVILAANVMASFLQLAVTNRDVPIRLRFDGSMSRWLIGGGLPFWSNGIFLTIYVWIDSVLLSLLASTKEVGYYAAPVQVLATFGFVPMLITSVIFPALSRDFHANFDQMRRLTRASLGGLVTIGLPITVGAIIVGPRAIEVVFGPAYGPSGQVMVVLALTIVPSFLATFVYWALAAADRQRWWAYVMGTAAIVNPLINLITIPYFQLRAGHGSIGAAVAILITDVAVSIAGLALMPRDCMRPIGPLVRMVARSSMATLLMAIPVLLLQQLSSIPDHVLLPIQVTVGVAVFGAAALALGVFRGDGYDEARAVLSAQLRRRIWRRAEVDVPA